MKDRLIELLGKADEATDILIGGFPSYEEEMRAFYASIADYLLDNGVIVLPCVAGDTVWAIYNHRVYEAKACRVIKVSQLAGEGYIKIDTEFEIENIYYGIGNENRKTIKHGTYGHYLEDVFLTKEEAEAKLEELEGVKE